jgi:thiamine-monophosphate kinase
MNEFSIIERYFRAIAIERKDVVIGIGDDAACLRLPPQSELLVSTDTLVAKVHFLDTWDAYDIAYRAVMVNVSDIIAMGGTPAWLTLALTLPDQDEAWLKRYSLGLNAALQKYQVALVGGDMTRGPLSMTPTILGFAPQGKAVRRQGAKVGDRIYLSGELGAAALAVASLDKTLAANDKKVLMEKLLHPNPCLAWSLLLQDYANAAIDISDGLSADLHHLCTASKVGAYLSLEKIPLHPLLCSYLSDKALDFALSGGDDYELCFTVSIEKEAAFLQAVGKQGLHAYPIGVIEAQAGLRAKDHHGTIQTLAPRGYQHF